MNRRAALGLLAVLIGCGGNASQTPPDGSSEAGSEVCAQDGCGGEAAQTPPDAASEAGPEVCAQDGCAVPLSAPEVNGVCGPSLHARANDCPGLTVRSGTCGPLTHLELQTVGPKQDCWYTTATGELVAAVLRSDAGFTKVAGTVPADACPTTAQVCDHTPF